MLSVSIPWPASQATRRATLVALSTVPPVSSRSSASSCGLDLVDQRLGGIDQIEIDRDAARVDREVQEEHSALRRAERPELGMERALDFYVVAAIGDQALEPIGIIPPHERADQARAGAGAPCAP